jgi:DNA polymerase
MGIGTNPDFDGAFAAALDWWREAGVDHAFLDEPVSWLPPPEVKEELAKARTAPKGMAPAPAPQLPPPTRLPETLEAFRDWWMTAPELDAGRCAGRVAPRGESSPELMVLVCAPESSDSERILSGPEGRVLDAFAAACGLRDEQIYRASALPCHSPGADWSPQSNPVICEALIRHIALVRPRRVLVIGFIILPLLNHTSPQGPAVSLTFNHEGATVPMLAVRRIPAVASQPRWKSALWQAWLDWAA